jgi:hypothetical protein
MKSKNTGCLYCSWNKERKHKHCRKCIERPFGPAMPTQIRKGLSGGEE